MPSLIPLDNTLGAALIGIILSTAIWGITCLQVWLYYTEYSGNDGWFMKTFVAVLMVLDSFHVALLTIFFYYYTVTNFGDFIALLDAHWSLSAQVISGDLLAMLVRLFFAYRVYLIGGRRLVLPMIIAILSLVPFASGLGWSIVGAEVGKFAGVRKLQPWAISGLSIAVFVDTLIAVSMVVLFWSQKREVNERMRRTLDTLMRYTINTGFLTSVFAFLTLITFVTNELALIFVAFYYILCRLYSCSFMSTLNSRHHLQQMQVEPEVVDLQTSLKFKTSSKRPTEGTATTFDTEDSSMARDICVGNGAARQCDDDSMC